MGCDSIIITFLLKKVRTGIVKHNKYVIFVVYKTIKPVSIPYESNHKQARKTA